MLAFSSAGRRSSKGGTWLQRSRRRPAAARTGAAVGEPPVQTADARAWGKGAEETCWTLDN